MMSDFFPLAAIATTPSSAQLLVPLTESMQLTLWVPVTVSVPNSQVYKGSLSGHLKLIWSQYRGFIFALSTGAVVRLIAPLLEDKSLDPAIVVIDALGQYVISFCSGHQGGADLLTRLVAIELNATPIITGASTSLNLPAIDILGKPWGWQKGTGDWTRVSAAMAAPGETLEVVQDAGSPLWQQHLPLDHPFVFQEAEGRSQESAGRSQQAAGSRQQAEGSRLEPQARVWISATLRSLVTSSKIPEVQWHPRVLWVGIGCSRGTSKKLIQQAVEETCQRYNLATAAIAGLVSLNIKADEEGIIEFSESFKVPFLTYPAELLKDIAVPNPSSVVLKEVGTPSVAEAAAIVAGGTLIVPKQIFQDETGQVTVAIAQAEREYIGKQGALYLVGTGPGRLEQMTSAAKRAVIEADVLIGYSLYLDLIEALKRPGQIRESYPITQERERASRAIELAQWGLTVAVVSSGDCGIYGMAGLVLESLQQGGWDGQSPRVEVFPGISALQSAAARLGAPLMHDFSAVSLSDLLTPWPVIEKRLEAVAAADFVIALYNPRSQNRHQPLQRAWEILLKYREKNTPVGIVKAAYRLEEEVILTTLGEMLDAPIDMLTTVIIGNQSTSRHHQWLITPRGYLQKNDSV